MHIRMTGDFLFISKAFPVLLPDADSLKDDQRNLAGFAGTQHKQRTKREFQEKGRG